MLVLGWHGNPMWQEFHDVSGYMAHDAAAVIVRDGEILAAIEEERLNRVKHSTLFPVQAIRFCLTRAGVELEQLDAIVTDSAEEFVDSWMSYELTQANSKSRQNGRELIAAAFRREFGLDVANKLKFCRHHFAHLCGTWYPSGFSEALVVCLDGGGDGLSGLVAYCQHDEIRILRSLPASCSLGDFYTTQIAFLGYGRFDEYKVMGLAPYGDANVYESLFKRMYKLESQGEFSLVSEFESVRILKDAGLADKARRKGEPFTQVHMDFAAALQSTLERIAVHVVDGFQRMTNASHLCLSGGVAHNCTMNGLLLRSGRFKDVFVQPAAHDAGNALGAALAVIRDAGGTIPRARDLMPHLFLGTDIGTTEDISGELRAWHPLINARRIENASEVAADLLAQGLVIGWVQGRSEFGPRALGNRSILADPRPAENKRIINAMVKKREDYRPFAPSVLEERLNEFFETPEGAARFPFMIMVLPVRPEVRALLGAVTHVDGSARVQSVTRADNPRYYALIEAFAGRTGIPIVLNTSFNNNAEPIVDTAYDAIVTFLTTGIQALVIGDWLVNKVDDVPHNSAFLDLVPELPRTRKLVRRTVEKGRNVYLVESTSRHLGNSSIEITPELFHVLLDETALSINERCRAVGVGDHVRRRLYSELFELWAARAVRLNPTEVMRLAS